MKQFLAGLLAGSFLMTAAVIATKGALAAMVVLGAIVALALEHACRYWIAQRVAKVSTAESASAVVRSERSSEKSPRPAREPRAKKNVLPSVEMLPTVQQEVLSALVNLGLPFKHALDCVRAAASEKSGESFDELFRLALILSKPRKAGSVAA